MARILDQDTKETYKVKGPFYHGTDLRGARSIYTTGLLIQSRGEVYLTQSLKKAKEIARITATQSRGSPAVVKIILPKDWLLELGESGPQKTNQGHFIDLTSPRDIPARYIRSYWPLEHMS